MTKYGPDRWICQGSYCQDSPGGVPVVQEVPKADSSLRRSPADVSASSFNIFGEHNQRPRMPLNVHHSLIVGSWTSDHLNDLFGWNSYCDSLLADRLDC
jgi:hypothetical protein